MKVGTHSHCRSHKNVDGTTGNPYRVCCVRDDLVPTVSELANWISGRVTCGALPPLGGLEALVPAMTSIEGALPGVAVVLSAQTPAETLVEGRIAAAKGVAGIICEHPLAVHDGAWMIQVPNLRHASARVISTYLQQSRARTILVKTSSDQEASLARLVAQRIRGLLRACGVEVSQILRWSYTTKPNPKKSPQSNPWCVLTSDAFPCPLETWDGLADVVVELPSAEFADVSRTAINGREALKQTVVNPRVGGCQVTPSTSVFRMGNFDILEYGVADAHVVCERSQSGGLLRFGPEQWEYISQTETEFDVLSWGSAVAATLAAVPCGRRIARSAQMQWDFEKNGLAIRAA